MSIEISSRYGHDEGLTLMCIDHISKKILTCGNDCDVRVWNNFDDDEPQSFGLEHRALAITCGTDAYFVALDTANVVRSYDKTSGTVIDSFVTKFPLPATHMCVNKSGKQLLIASSEVGVARWINLADHSFTSLGHDHSSLILSIVLNGEETHAATASGDGSIKIWQLKTDGTEPRCVKTLENVLNKTNSIRCDQPLGRLRWQQNDGQNSSQWFSVCCFSSCGRYVAAGGVAGEIRVWNLITGDLLAKERHKPAHICSLEWDPQNVDRLLYCDVQGEVGVVKNLPLPTNCVSVPRLISAEVKPLREDFVSVSGDRDDDDDLPQLQRRNDPQTKPRRTAVVEDDDDDSVSVPGIKEDYDIGALKARYNSQIGVDEHGITVDMPSNSADIMAEDVIARSRSPQSPAWKPPEAQPAFVVGSSPEHLSQRYMKWNAYGIVKQYKTGFEDTIEVQFHDVNVHHQFTIDNTIVGYSLADLSPEALALATSDKKSSQLFVRNLISWESSSKEWTVDVPKGEIIVGLCLGSGWIAVATDKRIVRVFTISGLQRYMFSLTGPFVTMCGSCDQLAVVFHQGLGIDGDQNLGYVLYRIPPIAESISAKDCGSLALSPCSQLTWLGFTAFGNLCSNDSAGAVRLLNRGFYSTWLPIGDLKAQTKIKSETLWVVNVLENPSQIRCLACRGVSYPVFLPKPMMLSFDWEIPMCDATTEKTNLEKTLIITKLRKTNANSADDEADIRKMERDAIVKLFAFCCKAERDCRALEVAKLMSTSDELQMLIRYATSQRRYVLAEKIAETAREMMLEEEHRITVERSVEEPAVNIPERPLRAYRQVSSYRQSKEETTAVVSADDDSMEQCSLPTRSEQDSQPTSAEFRRNRNPFKRTASEDCEPTSVDISALDKTLLTKKRPLSDDRKSDSTAHEEIKENTSKKQATLHVFRAGQNKGNNDTAKRKSQDKANDVENQIKTSTATEKKKPPPTTGFALWMEEHEDELKATLPADQELLKYAMQRFRQLNEDERKLYNKKVKNNIPDSSHKLDGNLTKRHVDLNKFLFDGADAS